MVARVSEMSISPWQVLMDEGLETVGAGVV
jgi:hypothetical protein